MMDPKCAIARLVKVQAQEPESNAEPDFGAEETALYHLPETFLLLIPSSQWLGG